MKQQLFLLTLCIGAPIHALQQIKFLTKSHASNSAIRANELHGTENVQRSATSSGSSSQSHIQFNYQEQQTSSWCTSEQEQALAEEESRKNTTTAQKTLSELTVDQKNSLPPSLSPFDHQICTLELNADNEIPLIVDNSQMSCIDYQLEGKSVGQLIIGNENVHFESQSPYHFSFIQPLKAAILTIITHSLSNKNHITCSGFGFKGDRFNCTPESTLTVNGRAQLEVDETLIQSVQVA